MRASGHRLMMHLIRLTYYSASAVCLFASLAVVASMLIAERAPKSLHFWIITIVVGMLLASAGLLLVGVGRQLFAMGALACSMTNGDGALLKRCWWRLAS